MTSLLPIGISALLEGAVEGVRLELKRSWDPRSTGSQVLKTLCAFANDLENQNGGYIILGVDEVSGTPVRPVQGLSDSERESAAKWIQGNCNRIKPIYMPVIDDPEIDGRRVLVLWAPASDVRPHQAPDGDKGPHEYWIRIRSETVAARGDLLRRLIQQTARVPFDDRRAFNATNADLRLPLAREFLNDVGSELVREQDAERVYAAMQIVRPQNGHSVPRNIGLLFFSDDPQPWFRCARIEVAEFRDDASGDSIQEQRFTGPLHHQLRQCLRWLENLTTRHFKKQRDVIETRGWVSYPLPALREALVNALYHRSYEDVVEPTKVYLYPNRIEIISYPGPVDGVEMEHLRGERPLPPVPARNRRIGEFFKELRFAEGRGTGIPKIRRSMRENGSSAPTFDFDHTRTYFRVSLPAHPEYVALTLFRDFAYRRATGDEAGALRGLESAWHEGQRSPLLAVELIRAYAERAQLSAARRVVDELSDPGAPGAARALVALAEALFTAGEENEARAVLDRLPAILSTQDAFDAAIAERRAGRQERAHRYFLAAGEAVLADPRALLELAQTKIHLAGRMRRSHKTSDKEVRARLLNEAEQCLERVLQMDTAQTRHAWAWYELGRVRQWRNRPQSDVLGALQRAVGLAPGEDRFRRALEEARKQSK